MPGPPPLVLFDLDGTLTDSAPGIVASLAHAFACLGVAVPSDTALRASIGSSLPDIFAEHLEEPAPARVERAIHAYRERFDRVGWRENQVYPGIPEQLDRLHAAGARTLVATSKPEPFAERIVSHFGLRGRFDRIYGSGLDGRRAQKAELLAHLLEREGVPAERCLMIGDRHHDVRGARAVGSDVIGVLWGYGSRDELEAAGATRLCASVDRLAETVASSRVFSGT